MTKSAEMPGSSRMQAAGTYPVQSIPPVGREGGRLRNEWVCKEDTKVLKGKCRGESHTPGEHPLGQPYPCVPMLLPSSTFTQLCLLPAPTHFQPGFLPR